MKEGQNGRVSCVSQWDLGREYIGKTNFLNKQVLLLLLESVIDSMSSNPISQGVSFQCCPQHENRCHAGKELEYYVYAGLIYKVIKNYIFF